MNVIQGFSKGFWAPAHAFKIIIRSPRLLSLVAIPVALNLCLYGFFFHYGAAYLDYYVGIATTQLAHTLPGWLVNISSWLLRLLSWLFLALAAMFTFTFVSGILSAPFNDLLSKAAMDIRTRSNGLHLNAPSVNLKMSEITWLELKRLSVLVTGAALALLIGLIPLMQLPALALGATLISFEYFGYPISQRSSSLASVAWFTLRHPAVSLGFGTFLLLIMALPFTSIIYIPLAVVAGTTLYADLAKELTISNEDKRKKT